MFKMMLHERIESNYTGSYGKTKMAGNEQRVATKLHVHLLKVVAPEGFYGILSELPRFPLKASGE